MSNIALASLYFSREVYYWRWQLTQQFLEVLKAPTTWIGSQFQKFLNAELLE